MQPNPGRRNDSEDLARWEWDGGTSARSAAPQPAREGERPSRRPLSDVLVATDLSAGAELALARALRLPCAAGAKLSLLHVVPGDTEGPVAREEEALLA